ncbi:hypothetical protein HDU81_010758 [Chytriomyces hyalinus]|nr:hypothetical protein HDU81_010758 [Chytriomyces hyalinus]
MSVISFVPQQLRRATLCNDFKSPKTTTRDSGIVAIIDISGYSKLSSHLQEVLGSDSGAKIKELLNPPIEIIIREVHRTGGSIVKFAGDAVIAVWTHSTNSPELTQNMIIGALSCCVQLLDRFMNYTISFQASAQEGFFTIGRPSTRTSVVKVPHSLIQDMKTQKLKIHIGLGFGVTHDIHLGVQINAEPVRSEFFVSGQAMAQSGQLLGEGSEGDLVLGENCWDHIKSIMPHEFSDSLELLQTAKNETAFRINERENLSGLIRVLSEKLDRLDTRLLDTGSENVPVAEADFKGQLAAILPYVDDALHHAVSTAKSLMDANIEPERYFEVLQRQTQYILNNYDQTRRVCIIFIQFQGFNVEAMHEAESVNKLQSIMNVLVKSIRKYQGCLRQINCDDKSLTALLVWGLQGFAHEKNEAEYVLPAAVEIASRLTRIVNTDFSIGVTSGSVFSGIVGDENRADGTVLGVAVNNAARIMCLPICRGAVLCDEETFMNASDSYQFDESIPKVELKGVPRPVKIYKPLESKNRCRIAVAEVAMKISGRDKEVAAILSSYQRWCQSERQRLIITGRSGAGKTTLMHFYHSLLDINPNVISCVGKGQEHHQNTMLFCYSQIISDLFKSIMDRNINLEKVYRRDSWSKSHMAVDEYLTAPHTGTRESLCTDTSIHDFIVRTFPPVTWEIWGSVPNLMKQSREKKPAVGDLVTKLAILFSRVLNALHKLELRVCFTLDDTQWCDSYSIDLTQKLQHSCGQELFLIFSRPQEEFKPSLVPEFRRIIEAPATTHIELRPLDFAGIEAIVKQRFRHMDKENDLTVDPAIVTSILEQSEGNSMLVTSSITMLQEDSNIVLKDGVLTFREAKTGQKLAAGNDSIILAQFDKLGVEMKGILRVASVAGQYFDIDEVRDIMNQSQIGGDITSDKISDILESSDPYKFVKRTEKLNIRMFSHFLIQQAIQAAMVPLKRASIHKLFADYYEITLNDENRSSHLQALIFHLFKLPGEELRKQKHVYSAFMDSAESFRCKEAFEYHAILNSFVPKAEFATTPIDKARECRLMAQLYFETKESSKAVDGVFKGLAILGFVRPPKKLGKLKVFVKATLLLQKLVKSSKPKQVRLCRKFVCEMFPIGFEEYLKLEHASKLASSQAALTDHFNNIIEEIMLQLEFVTKPLVILADGVDTLMVASLLSVIGFLAIKYQPIRSALCWARIAASYAMAGLLSSHLQEVLGSDSGAKIKELLNPPIEIIIREVHRTGGSIVKFAGDAVIAVWTHSTNSPELTQNMIIGALSCCVQLLDRFMNYTISFQASAQEGFFTIGRPSTRTSVVKVPHSLIQDMKTQKLKIHIGLGFGVTHDIHLGVQINAEPVRSEFFVSGQAMAQSGQLLGEGSEGDLVLGENCWDHIKSIMPHEFSDSLELLQTAKNETAFRINERENLSGLIRVLSEKLDRLDTRLLDTGSENVPVAEADFKGQLAAILPYVDDALHHAVSTAKSLMDANIEPERYFEVLQRQTQYILNNYDQTRRVCIIFIQFQGFNVEAMHEAESVNKLQSIMNVLVKSIRKYQGCLRQINCDDKSLTALLVWGLQGFAHEKNEAEYVLPAAVEIASRLTRIVNTDFSIGVTSGSVFSGIVGDENRADGTVLGVAVNNAARIMCLPICRGAVLCDEETFMNASDSYQFDESIPKVELKGVPRPVKIYKPLESKNRCRIAVAEVAMKISGRDKEVAAILSSYQRWCQSERQRLIITGRSGAGKTTLMHFYHSLLDINPNVISCVGKGQEHHQNTMLFCYSQIISDLFKSIMDRNINLEKVYRRDSWSKSHMAVDEYLTAPHTGTRESLCTDTSIHDFIVRTFPPVTWEIWGSVPNLMKQSREKKPAVGDLVTKLAILFSRVLNALHKLELRVCFTLDDTQWCDSYSIDLTQKLQHSCGQELFLIFSRPQEEFKPSLVPEFRRIIEAPATTHIELRPLDFAGIEAIVKQRFRHMDKENDLTVDPAIVTSILEQSEGNSMLVTSSITMLQEDSNIVLKDGVLTFREAKTGQKLAAGNDSIILAQFDKLGVEMKGILRVASVAGQYFDIDEVRDIMNQSQIGGDITSDKISDILESSDPYKFVKRTEKLNIRMFSHFLIQQAIQAAMVPLKRASIHKLFADYYEITLNDENRSSHLQALIFHLFKLPGEELRKQKHVYSAFMDSAESFRCKEAFEYHAILNSFVPKAEFATTPIDKARECRLMAQLYFETKESSKAVDGVFKGLAILGFVRPPKKLGKLKVFVKATLLLQKLVKSSKPKQVRLCRKFVCEMFPIGFEEYLKLEHASKLASSQAALTDHFNNIIEEIMLQLEFVTKPLVILADGVDTLMVASLLSVIGFLAIKYQPIRSALCWARIAASYAMAGLVNFSEKAATESSKLLESSGFSRSSSNLSSYATDLYARIFDARGLMAFGASRFRATADCFQFQNELNEAIGIEHTSKAYYNRNLTHMSLVLGGYFLDYASAIEKGAQFFEESEERQFDVACLQLVRAVYESNQLNYSECLVWMNKSLPFIRRNYGDAKNESPTLSMFLETFLLSIALQQMGLAKTSTEFSEWQDKCCENVNQIVRVVRLIYEGKKTNFMHGCWIYLCPLVCEWVFLGKSPFGSSEVAISTTSLLLIEMRTYFKKSRPKRPSCSYLSVMQLALADLRKGNSLKFQKRASKALAIAKGKDYWIDHFEAQMRSRILEASLVYGTRSSSDPKVQAELLRLHKYFTEGQSLREADKLAKYISKE